MAEVIEIGKRSLEYNPTVEKIKKQYPDDLIVLDCMFTWDVKRAKERAAQIRLLDSNKRVIVDGVGWRNAGNDGYIDLGKLDGGEVVLGDCDVQVTKITEGCPKNCPYCFSGEFRYSEQIPPIMRNKVKFSDENLLAHPDIERILKELTEVRVNGRVVHYEAICGFDRDFLTGEIAALLKGARFINVRIAWDEPFTDASQKKTQKAVKVLVRAGFDSKLMSCFVLTNERVSYGDCLKKLDLLKVWRVKVNDCCFNCSYNDPKPQGWTMDEIKEFRRKARKHNQLVLFGIDPEVSTRIGG